MHDILNDLDGDSDLNVSSVDVYVNPPGDGTNSDEDDANDEMMDGLTLNNLPGRQLNAAAEAVVRLRDGENRRCCEYFFF